MGTVNGMTEPQRFLLSVMAKGGELQEEYNPKANREKYTLKTPSRHTKDVTIDARTFRACRDNLWIEVVPHVKGVCFSAYRLTADGRKRVWA